ncbi:portal protein [Xanthomonas citri pv. citri]
MDIETARAKLDAAAAQPTLQLRQHCDRRRAAMIAARETWMPDWMQVTEYIDPARGQFNGEGSTTTRKKRSRSKIINGTATKCVRVATAGMSSHMTSKARPWFNLTTPDPAMGQVQDVRVWLDNVTTILRDTLAKSNFYKAMPVCYTEDLSYGVAAMMIVENPEEVVRFHPLTIGSYAIGLDDAGKVDSLWRCYTKTARQLVQKYGRLDPETGQRVPDESKLPQRIIQAYKRSPDQEFTVEALYEPNPDARPGMGPLGVQAPKFRPFREVVWIAGSGDEKHGVLDIGGHYEQPFVSIRFNPVGDDTYSACPGTDSLGDIKQLQYLEGQKLRLIDLMAEPPVTVPDTMRNIGASLAPRTKNYLPQNQNGAKIEATYTPQPGSLQWVQQEIREVEARIQDSFYYNLFLMLESLGEASGRTATEIAERKEEKATVLGPTLEIVTDEGLDPTVVRVFRLCERAGLIPPPPAILASIPLKIEYTSILAQAMKASGTSGIERTGAFVAQMASVFGPEVMDKFDADQAVDEYSERTGAPASIIRDDDAVLTIRQGRAAQQAQQAALAAAKPMADGAQAIKTLNEAVPQPGSLGEGLAEQLRGGQAA